MKPLVWYTLDEHKNVIPCPPPYDDPSNFTLEKRAQYNVGHTYFTYEHDGKPDWIWVATDFLWLDHNYKDDGPPLVFETMFFDYPPNDQGLARCSTWKEAERLHAEATHSVRRWLTAEGYAFTESTEAPLGYLAKREAERKQCLERPEALQAQPDDQDKAWKDELNHD